MNLHPAPEDEDEAGGTSPDEVLRITLDAPSAGLRLDRALAQAAPELSRARVQALLAEGRVRRNGEPCLSASAKALEGDYELYVPPPAPATPEPEDIALDVLFEDAHLIVVNKPAGMAVHPAPGSETGTLVNALLHHCRGQLSGIGGVARPGIVHRIDKETSGVLVAAKSDAAHQGLTALFARHDIERLYVALVRGAPTPQRGTIETQIARSTHDRKKMAVVRTGGRRAVTHYATQTIFGDPARPCASRLSLRLETGRTHQIRVHLASRGHPCLGDPVYGSGQPQERVRAAVEASGLRRQALHAEVLGFVHPVSGEAMRFETPLPKDMAQLQILLSDL